MRFDPLMKRLKKMRAYQVRRSLLSLDELYHKVKAIARNARLGWLKGKVRWFTVAEEFEKIRANIQVETSMGRSEPELWLAEDKHSNTFRKEFASPSKNPPRVHNEAHQQWQHKINPMSAEDQMHFNGQPVVEFQLPDGKEGSADHAVEGRRYGRLRLLQANRTTDIVRTAESLIEEIRQICHEDLLSSEANEQAENTAASSDVQLIGPDDNDETPAAASDDLVMAPPATVEVSH